MNRLLLTFLFILFVKIGFAQKTLSLRDAQNIAIENNFGIKVSQKQIDWAENQIYKGNAGMTPLIDWNTNVNSTFNQVNQNFIDGRVINRFGRSFGPNTNLSMVYTLYDGRRMNANFERLKSQGQQAKISNQIVVQNVLSNVTLGYYDIQRLSETVDYLKVIIKYYEERLKITEERWQIGRGSKLDFLQSKADYNIQLANLINVTNQLKNAKIRMNGLLARNSDLDFEIEKDNFKGYMYNLTELIDEFKSQNPEFLNIKKSEEINLLSQKEAKSFKLPRINLNSSFGYNFNTNNAGLITSNQSLGLNAGLTAIWRVFDGQQINRNIQTTKINAEILKIQENDILNQIENDLTSAYYQYENDKQVLDLESGSKEVAEENLEIALEKFKLGSSTILEINDAQTRYNTVLNRLVSAQFNVKVSELELLRLSGRLIK
jgi:outer membrane protein TolC